MIKEITVKSLSHLIEEITSIDGCSLPIWFRGQASAQWGLNCSLSRHGGIEKELPLIRRFKQNAVQIISKQPNSEWEWWLVMQHYGLPTRLLDFSESPLVALFFAVSDPSSVSDDGCLWTIFPEELNKLSKLESNGIMGFGEDEHLNQYLPGNIAKQRMPFEPIAVLAPRNTPRIQSQQGVFVVFHKDLSPIKEDHEDLLIKYLVPAEKKEEIKNGLAKLGISYLSLFPELNFAAAHAKELCHE